jgi:hypothetical protein
MLHVITNARWCSCAWLEMLNACLTPEVLHLRASSFVQPPSKPTTPLASSSLPQVARLFAGINRPAELHTRYRWDLCRRHLRVIAELSARCRWQATCRRRALHVLRSMPPLSCALATSVASSFVPASSFASMNLDSPKQQEDVALCMLQTYVSGVSYACCKFYWNVAKVYQNVAYVVMAIYVLPLSLNICRFRFPRNNFD